MSVARFIADQRTNYRVPHTVTCALLGVSLSWFYKWSPAPGQMPRRAAHRRGPAPRAPSTEAVAVAFGKAKGSARLAAVGAPTCATDGWTVSEKTVADSMRRQGLVARRIRRRNGLTRQDKTAPKFPDLLKRDFTAERAQRRSGWAT